MLGGVDLSVEELRVLGCLVEKQLTTPQHYPLTLNALHLACNQSSNRDPVVTWTEATVESAVTSVKAKGLAAFVHPSHGRSALRFRHTLDEALGLESRPMALLCVLLLRGPQTPGELRSRTERMASFADLHEVQAELDALASRAEPLVVRLERRPGHKEDRYAQLLGGGDPSQGARRPGPVRVEPPVRGDGPSGAGDGPTEGRHGAASGRDGARPGDDLRVALESLRAEVAALRADLDDLRAQLGA